MSKKPLKIKVRMTLTPSPGVKLWIDDSGIVFIDKELGASRKADEFVEFVQRICKYNNWENRLKNISTKAQVLGLERLHKLPDPRQG
jgi:hypothetical protein